MCGHMACGKSLIFLQKTHFLTQNFSLWEIFSFAMRPYFGMSHEEVVKFIKEGNMLSCPENTPLVIYDLMRHCWNRKPSERPSFQYIYNTLQHIKNDYDSRILH